MRRALSRFSGVSTSRCRPRPPARAPAAASRENSPRTRSMSCSAASTVRFSPCQRRTRSSRSAEVLASMALNGSSSTITRASCSSSRANSMRCICPPDSVPMARSSKPVRPTAAIASSIGVAVLAADAAEQAGAAPQAHRHHVVDVDREGAVDLGGLRQVGDVLRRPAPPRSMRPASGLITPTMPLNSVDLPAPFGPDHGHQRAGRRPRRRDDARPGGGRSRASDCGTAALRSSRTRLGSCHGPEHGGPDQRDQHRRPPPAAPAPTAAGSTARSTPADGRGRDGDGGDGAGAIWVGHGCSRLL